MKNQTKIDNYYITRNIESTATGIIRAVNGWPERVGFCALINSAYGTNLKPINDGGVFHKVNGRRGHFARLATDGEKTVCQVILRNKYCAVVVDNGDILETC